MTPKHIVFHMTGETIPLRTLPHKDRGPLSKAFLDADSYSPHDVKVFLIGRKVHLRNTSLIKMKIDESPFNHGPIC
jgi:hypothetical protein